MEILTKKIQIYEHLNIRIALTTGITRTAEREIQCYDSFKILSLAKLCFTIVSSYSHGYAKSF